MTLYKFNIKLGHYVAINEGQVPVEGLDNTENDKEQPQKVSVINLETPEITKMENDRAVKVKNAQDDLAKKNNKLILLKNKLALLLAGNNATQDGIRTLLLTVLLAQADVDNATLNVAKINSLETQKILAAQKKLLESQRRLPDKYKYLVSGGMLNESNVQNAKVYINDLINNDSQERIKGMVDFKKAFGNAELLYGKDKEGGYFAVCVDQEDLNKLTRTLEAVGFNRDQILAEILPQIFDRSNLTK